MRIGFIGYGEAAYEMSFGLSKEKLDNMIAYDPMWDNPSFKDLIYERAEHASVEILTSMQDVVQKATILIVAVPADQAYRVSESIAPFLTENQLYVDVSASAPDVKMQIADVVASKQALFVDAAMMGSLPVYKHQVPILASGTGTDQFIKTMTPYHMDIQKVSEKAGGASATKLIRSIYMKGVSALLIEMLEAAKHFEVEDLVTESVIESMSKQTFEATMNRLVTGTAIHSRRRAVELEGTLSMLETAGLSSVMTKAAKEKLEELTSHNLNEQFNGQKPESWEEVIELLGAVQSSKI